jgi:hypothetical protein
MYLQQMFAFEGTISGFALDAQFYTMLALGMLFAFYGGFGKIEAWQVKIFAKEQRDKVIMAMVAGAIILLVICAGSITSQGFNPFIYFRF